MLPVNDQMRIEAWLDSLPFDERNRAEQLASLPPGMAVARADRDLRAEMAAGFARLERAISANPPRPGFSKKAQAVLILIGTGIVQGAVAAFHNLGTPR